MSGGELIRQAASAVEIAGARTLFEEYAASIGVDLCFQGFDAELAGLPGYYAPPQGRLLLAGRETSPLGCVALRPLPGSAPADVAGEIKRLYVRPEARGTGLGAALARAVIAEARAIGYRELKLDTLEGMGDARRLYAKLGFRECDRYYDNPLPGVVYMSLEL